MKKAIVIVVSLLVFAVVWNQPAWGQKVRNISIATASMGGAYYPMGVAISQLLNKELPNVKATVQVTGGTIKNIDILGRKEAEISFSQGQIVSFAARNLEVFKGRDTSWLQVLANIGLGAIHILVTSDIKSLQDLKGRRVAVGPVGSAGYINAKTIFDALGMDFMKDIRQEHVSFAESADLLRDKHISASLILGFPSAAVIDLMSTGGFKILEFSNEEMSKIRVKEPIFVEFIIPANFYKNQPRDARIIGMPSFLLVRSDLEEELVYQITKTIFENIGELRQKHKAFEDLKLEKAPEAIIVPVHPGAARYYREKLVLK